MNHGKQAEEEVGDFLNAIRDAALEEAAHILDFEAGTDWKAYAHVAEMIRALKSDAPLVQ